MKRLKLSRSVVVGRVGNTGLFGIGSHQTIVESQAMFNALLVVSNEWKEYLTDDEIFVRISKKYPQIEPALVRGAVSKLMTGNYLVEEGGYDAQPRYDRNLLYYSFLTKSPSEFHGRLLNSQVTILGCGGIGIHVAAILVTCGVKRVFLIDDDLVEESNLTRQILFAEDDVGASKVDTLARELRRRNSAADIVPINHRIKSRSDLAVSSLKRDASDEIRSQC